MNWNSAFALLGTRCLGVIIFTDGINESVTRDGCISICTDCNSPSPFFESSKRKLRFDFSGGLIFIQFASLKSPLFPGRFFLCLEIQPKATVSKCIFYVLWISREREKKTTYRLLSEFWCKLYDELLEWPLHVYPSIDSRVQSHSKTETIHYFPFHYWAPLERSSSFLLTSFSFWSSTVRDPKYKLRVFLWSTIVFEVVLLLLFVVVVVEKKRKEGGVIEKKKEK